MDIKKSLNKANIPTEGYPLRNGDYPYYDNCKWTDIRVEDHNFQKESLSALAKFTKSLNEEQLQIFLKEFAIEFFERGQHYESS